MTTPDTSTSSRRVRANGDGTVYQRKDGRWEAAGYVLGAWVSNRQAAWRS